MNATTYKIGQDDGGTMAREAAISGIRINTGEKNFDEGLIAAMGLVGTAKLFGFAGSHDELKESPDFSDALASYESGACRAWDEFAESEECKTILSDFADARNAEWSDICE